MSEILIGVCGPARSGKNEIANYLVKYHAFHQDSFAAPIRNALIDILGLTGLDELDQIKEQPHPLLGGRTPRYAMQTMGTEWGRQLVAENIWVDTCLGRLEKYERAVIFDVRFENEAKAIKDKGGFIVHVDRPSVRIVEGSHVSEAGIPERYIDYRIKNDSDLGNLYLNAETLIRTIFKDKYIGEYAQ